MEYRKTLYQNYYTTQSGKQNPNNLSKLFHEEKWRFKIEIIPLLQGLAKNAKIIDLGCGSGSLLKALDENGFTQVFGIDISPEQIQVAKTMGVHNIKCMDIQSFFEEDKNKYDLILGMDIIEHFTKNELVDLLQKIKNKLNFGGQVVFRTPNMDAILPNRYAFGDFTHECLLNSSSAQQLGLACGYGQVEIKSSNMRIKNPTFEFIRKFLFFFFQISIKIQLFITGRSVKNLILSPNMIVMLK
ncbi:MAG: class I SAM-dependent methyltransferase [Saprospiraceae bacterium]|nr:class I SAM-dependent methyltransferase [Saprospiraceae bacterium]